MTKWEKFDLSFILVFFFTGRVTVGLISRRSKRMIIGTACFVAHCDDWPIFHFDLILPSLGGNLNKALSVVLQISDTVVTGSAIKLMDQQHSV